MKILRDAMRCFGMLWDAQGFLRDGLDRNLEYFRRFCGLLLGLRWLRGELRCFEDALEILWDALRCSGMLSG